MHARTRTNKYYIYFFSFFSADEMYDEDEDAGKQHREKDDTGKEQPENSSSHTQRRAGVRRAERFRFFKDFIFSRFKDLFREQSLKMDYLIFILYNL